MSHLIYSFHNASGCHLFRDLLFEVFFGTSNPWKRTRVVWQ